MRVDIVETPELGKPQVTSFPTGSPASWWIRRFITSSIQTHQAAEYRAV